MKAGCWKETEVVDGCASAFARLDAAGGLLSRQVVGAQQADLYPETFVARKSDPRCWCQQELAGLSL